MTSKHSAKDKLMDTLITLLVATVIVVVFRGLGWKWVKDRFPIEEH